MYFLAVVLKAFILRSKCPLVVLMISYSSLLTFAANLLPVWNVIIVWFSNNCVRQNSVPVFPSLGLPIEFVRHCNTISLPSKTAAFFGTTVSIPLHSEKIYIKINVVFRKRHQVDNKYPQRPGTPL